FTHFSSLFSFLAHLWLFLWSHCSISASMLETIVRPGDNITIYCDCKVSTGIYVVWFRNCSHQYQPTLVVDWKTSSYYERKITFPRFKFVKNESSNSYDLMIINVTNSDEGLYYCETLENKVKQHENKNLFSQEDENVCYAALEIHQPSQRSKRKRTIQSSDFSTYSAIKTFQEEISI
uniref:Ig-like domain-containing protein n=1 Tax=Xiphophorus couchianus TaxID=32473 RepID=A0A3B5MEV0_9TELE